MLTLLTGLPGAGKTLYLLSKLIVQYRGRRIFTSGIPGINHEVLGTEELKNPEKWYDLPEGAVVFIDEAQRIFPQRGPSQAVPEKCRQFETHRHRGFDVVLLTQDATTLDAHVRKLCGKHYHVFRLFGGQSSNVYEYPQFQAKPTEKNAAKGALSVSTFKFDKEVFNLYHSADMHTVKRKIPFRFILGAGIMGLCVFAIGYAIWHFTWGKGMELGRDPQPAAASFPAVASPGSMQGSGKGVVTTAEDYSKLMTPLIPGVLHSSPFYQSVFRARTFPRPWCIIIETGFAATRCACYTQQITKYDTTDEVCRDVAANGFFDPTIAERGAGRASVAADRNRVDERDEDRG